MTRSSDHLVALKVSAEIAARGTTIAQVADATGISRMTLTRRLTGNSSFTVTELDLISAHFGTTADELLAAARAGAA